MGGCGIADICGEISHVLVMAAGEDDVSDLVGHSVLAGHNLGDVLVPGLRGVTPSVVSPRESVSFRSVCHSRQQCFAEDLAWLKLG